MAKLTIPIVVDWDGIKDRIKNGDLVEVVRCKDCKHYRDSFPYDTCDVFDEKATDAEDYCSYGERKETEDAETIHRC